MATIKVVFRIFDIALKKTYTHTHTHSEYVIIVAFPRQHWLRERTSLLRYTYSFSPVPCYVLLLCTMCSVYRVPSVILCSSALIQPSFFAVTAVRFEMWCHFSTRELRVYYQSRAQPNTAHTCAWEGIHRKCYNLF